MTISKSVKEAGIPKGSFYQYFEDKFDLFYHIIKKVSEMKKKYFLPVLDNMKNHTFFESLGFIYKAV